MTSRSPGPPEEEGTRAHLPDGPFSPGELVLLPDWLTKRPGSATKPPKAVGIVVDCTPVGPLSLIDGKAPRWWNVDVFCTLSLAASVFRFNHDADTPPGSEHHTLRRLSPGT